MLAVAGLIAVSAVFIEPANAESWTRPMTQRQKATIINAHQNRIMYKYGNPQKRVENTRRAWGGDTYSQTKAAQLQAQQRAARQQAQQQLQQQAQRHLQQERSMCVASCSSIYNAGARFSCQTRC
jgi:hypothetical protein